MDATRQSRVPEQSECHLLSTLFQAGSISKPVTALAALHYVEGGRFSLDADINTKLRSWKVPDNEFTHELGSADDVA